MENCKMIDHIDEEVQKIIEKDNLQAHVEGGFYIRTYCSPNTIEVPSRYTGERFRPASTRIKFLLVKEDYSTWHRLKSDETWRYLSGSSLSLYIINKANPHRLEKIKIGNPEIEEDALLEYTVNYNQWFAASLNNKKSYSYVECEVVPGFVFDDFQLGDESILISKFPQHVNIIKKFSRKIEVNIPTESHKVQACSR